MKFTARVASAIFEVQIWEQRDVWSWSWLIVQRIPRYRVILFDNTLMRMNMDYLNAASGNRDSDSDMPRRSSIDGQSTISPGNSK